MPPSYATFQEACGKYTKLSKYLDICVYATHVYHDIIFLIEENKSLVMSSERLYNKVGMRISWLLA